MILGIDTSTDRMSLALADQENVVNHHQMLERRHGETLLPAIQKLLQQNRLSITEVTGVVVGVGPGSFTGIRIGVATAIGLAQSLNVPIVGLSSYLAIAANSGSDQVVVIGDARREAVYAAGYKKSDNKWESFLKESLTTLSKVIELIGDQVLALTGPDATIFFDEIKKNTNDLVLIEQQRHLPDAGVLVQLGKSMIAKGGQSFDQIQPIYLRRTQAEELFEKNTSGH